MSGDCQGVSVQVFESSTVFARGGSRRWKSEVHDPFTEAHMCSYVLIALLSISPAWAGKKKAELPTAPPPAATAAAAVDPAFEADIRRLMEVTGSAALGKQAMDQMLLALRPMATQLPESFWKELEAEIDPNQLVELTVPIYTRHLTHADVKELLVFYESPVGKKMIAVQPAIMAEAMTVGQAWGQEVGARVMKKMQAESGM